ncbi:hypothetical protein B1H10_04800 [candidate division KSB1 bacterium 4484_188]|nr:MAG: hypothetical protein B1H10_04800 [candidate division KSB1 bacterium 4484_188]
MKNAPQLSKSRKEKKKLEEMEEAKKKLESLSVKEEWIAPSKVFEAGLSKIEMFGVGGMGTRGFGRVRWVIDSSKTNSPTAENQEGNKNG